MKGFSGETVWNNNKGGKDIEDWFFYITEIELMLSLILDY